MTATDELRALLDERGVEWEDFDGEPTWAGGDGRMHYARQEFTFAGLTDEVTVYHLTPEQAIDATLGRGTCHAECFDDGMDEGMDGEWCTYAPPTWYLSCGHEVYGSERPCYCSVCGRRVVE